jgi:hypothetical protein
MAKFIATKDGCVNLDHVVKVSPNFKGDKYVVYLAGDQETTTAHKCDVGKSLFPVYPADPGTTVLAAWAYQEDGEWNVQTAEHAVVAWQSDEYGILSPVTATCTGLASNDRWLLPTGSGKVWDLSDDKCVPYDSLDEAKRVIMEEAKAEASKDCAA